MIFEKVEDPPYEVRTTDSKKDFHRATEKLPILHR